MKPQDQTPSAGAGPPAPGNVHRDPARRANPDANRDQPTPLAPRPADGAGALAGGMDTRAEDALDLALDDLLDEEVPSADVRSDSYDDEANERR